MQVIEAIEEEIRDLQRRGLLKWIYNDEQEYKLFDNPFFLDILKVYDERSRIYSFLVNDKDFHFIIYYDEDGNQKNLRFIWDCESRIEDLCKK